MYIIGLLVATVALMFVLHRRRRQPGEPFDWSYRRPWWRPRWAFPDNR
jgi:hypothetical protein